jgi:tRNA pseudouridine55 synthase
MDGILVVAKAPGYTSHDVVAVVRRLTGTRRAGHGGTLDPFAAGVLPVFLGLATRLVEYHMADDKAYRATICFGASTETDDRDGELVPGDRPAPARQAVEAALADFRGPILQRPPSFSAMKVGGRRAYQLAREGAPPALAPRSVSIHRLELIEWDGSDPARPVAVVEVECGAGTYIRSLARDLGERFGCGAYLGALTRTASGPFRIDQAHDLEVVRAAAAAGPTELANLMLPIDAGLGGIASVVLNEAEAAAVVRGQQVKPTARPQAEQNARLRLLDAHESLIGMGSWKAGRVVPEKIFVGLGDGDGTASASAPAAPPPQRVGERPLRVVRAGNRMTVVPGIDNLTPDLGRLYVAVGVFDGLHRGHLYLLRELRRAAARAGARPAIVTFDAHPEEVIEGLAPPLLCDPDERLVRLEAAGIEVAVVQHFDHALRTTTYEEFVARIASRVDLAGFAMTPDAAFGFERRGTPEALADLGARNGFAVTVVNSYLLDGEQVRSSEIRRRVTAGDLDGARQLLGRPLDVTGKTEIDGGESNREVAAGAASPPRRLEFDVPVCLPPDGSYPVLVGSGWAIGKPPVPAITPATATIAGGHMEVASASAPPDGPIRVTFVDSQGASRPVE